MKRRKQLRNPLDEQNRPEGCPLLQPSANHGLRFVNGEAVGVPLVLSDLLFRAALIGAGMYAFGGVRKGVVKTALAGSLAVEAFVLTWIAITKK